MKKIYLLIIVIVTLINSASAQIKFTPSNGLSIGPAIVFKSDSTVVIYNSKDSLICRRDSVGNWYGDKNQTINLLIKIISCKKNF